MALEDRQNRTIVFNIPETIYSAFMQNHQLAHQLIEEAYESHSELFPAEMAQGYVLNGKTRVSKKLNLQLRKIKVAGKSYQLRPSFLLPAMRAKTQEVSKPLFLLRFGVPFWALAFVFGHNPMWWYRMYLCLGRCSLVGTTVYDPDKLPQDVLADEQHIRLRGQKAYVATTIGQNCMLGAEVCAKADEATLREGYGVFRQEVQAIQITYQPVTVNTDGWGATQNAWQYLFPKVAVIECFLHAFIKVRDRATKKLEGFFAIAADKIWDCYRAESKRQLAQQLRRLGEWTEPQLPDCAMKDNILKLCSKKGRWIKHLDFPSAHRTSNMLDRVMKAMSGRRAFGMHSTLRCFTVLSIAQRLTSERLRYSITSRPPVRQLSSRQRGLPAQPLDSMDLSIMRTGCKIY